MCSGIACGPLLPLSLTGQNIRKLVKDGFVIRKPGVIHSRSRARATAEAKAAGRNRVGTEGDVASPDR